MPMAKSAIHVWIDGYVEQYLVGVDLVQAELSAIAYWVERMNCRDQLPDTLLVELVMQGYLE
jgi:hypothetical protein